MAKVPQFLQTSNSGDFLGNGRRVFLTQRHNDTTFYFLGYPNGLIGDISHNATTTQRYIFLGYPNGLIEDYSHNDTTFIFLPT